jgi:tRNA threonylcarbamoyladenosine biosynthesis protein TsaB
MLLAIDTATRWTGVALHDGSAVVIEVGWQAGQTQTVELAPAVADVLRRVGLAAADLAGVAVSLGPGSYTGLRVGLALAKGLALANQTPLIGVPTLDIMAASLGELAGQLMVIVEAGRSRVIAGPYQWKGNKGWQAAATPVITSWPDLLHGIEAKGQDGAAPAVTFAGEVSAEAARLIREKKMRLVSPADGVRRAGYLAEIGWRRLRKGQVDDAAELVPIYLREPGGQ